MAKYVGFRQGKVHESHVISEYYCGGCGFPVTDHDSFCPECGGAFRECDADDLESENAKLRDIVHMYASYVDDDRCEGCVHKRACNEGMVEVCWQLTEIRKAEKAAHELGIEI